MDYEDIAERMKSADENITELEELLRIGIRSERELDQSLACITRAIRRLQEVQNTLVDGVIF